jgi:hypothetical protein
MKMAFKSSWMRPIPFFVLGMYIGGNLSAFRPLFNTLEELEITSKKLIMELESKTIELNFKLQQCQLSAAEAAGLVAKSDLSLSKPNQQT